MHRFLALSLVAAACSCSTDSGRGTKDAAPSDDGEAGASSGGRNSGGTSGSRSSGGVAGGPGDASAGKDTADASSGLDSGDAARGDDSGGVDGAADGSVTIDTAESVLQRNKHLNRDGAFVQPNLTPAVVARFSKETGFKATFPGAMYASPLYLEKGPGGKGVFFAVTTGNDVLALDETTGATVWQKNIGPSPTQNGVPCGNVHPLGIVSTPVIDPKSGTIYVAGAIGTASIERHEVHALSVIDGTERAGFPAVVSAKSGATAFTPAPQNQRAALSLVNGILYVAYGGHGGDCGDYHGWVIGIDTQDPTKTGGWATLGRGEGIWASGGLPSDGNGVFAVTGNNTYAFSDHMMSDGEEVVRITGLGVLDRSDKNLYFPAVWRTLDATDQDFGANNAVYVKVPGSTPENVLVAPSKAGHMYLLDPNNLGGMGKELVDFPISSGIATRGAPAAYASAKGVHVVLSMEQTTFCPRPSPTGRVLMSILLAPGSPPKPQIEWCAASVGQLTSPIATTTDGTSNPIVWYMNGTSLRALDGETGAQLYQADASNVCAAPHVYTSPIGVKGRLIVGADGQLCAWSAPH